MSKEFLVVYKEDQPFDDTVSIDVDAELPTDYEAHFSVSVTNRSGLLALIGLICTIIGGLLALATAVLFMINYPDKWWDDVDATVQRLTAALGSIGIILLILGNLLVGFGRRLHAYGALHTLQAR